MSKQNQNSFVVLALLSAFAAFTNGRLFAEEGAVSPFESHVFQVPNGQSLPYRLLRPVTVEPGKKYPLILFLHGAGERGTDNVAQLKHVAQELATPEMQKRHPAFVIAPQCPTGKQWVDTPWTADSHTMPEQPSETLALTIALLAQQREQLPIDPDRIYLVGLSMGGFGVWDLLQRDPTVYAAALPICGGGDPAFAAKIKDVPLWTAHGDADTVVKVKRSREMVAALQSCGGKPIYTEYPGVAHDSWTATAKNRLTWDWLFAQHKSTSK
ncbi:carboxylesterase family protein [Planctomicrobium piriforme]|nr:alpha/beta hydrolase-fold protein [Planctomicrobium piriforme]